MSFSFTKDWVNQDFSRLSDEEISDLCYEVLLSTGVSVEQVSERKWQQTYNGEVVKEGTYKDEASMRRSWVPNYVHDLSSIWEIMPYPNDNITFTWTIIPHRFVNNRGWQVAVVWTQVQKVEYITGLSPEEALLKTYIKYVTQWKHL